MHFRLFLLSLFLIFTLSVQGQEQTIAKDTTINADSLNVAADSLATDTVKYFSDINYDFAVYGAFSGLVAPNPDGFDFHTRYSGGVVFKKVLLEAHLTTFQGSYVAPLIFPNNFQINYIHAGVDLGYYFMIKKNLELSFLLGYSRGDMLWERSDNFENLFRDEFSMLSLKGRLEAMLIKELRLFAELGYQHCAGLELPQLAPGEFSGLTASLGVKVGFHKMQRLKKQ
jgi:hypothetical protein